MQYQIRFGIKGGFIPVNQNQPISLIIVDQSRRGINSQAGTCHNEQIRSADGIHAVFQRLLIQSFLIQYHIGLHGSAAAAAGDALGVQDEVQIMKLSAPFTVVPVDAAVQFQHPVAAGGLMESVDVLGDDGLEFSLVLPLCQFQVGGVGFCVRCQQLGPVKTEKLFRVAFIKRMT